MSPNPAAAAQPAASSTADVGSQQATRETVESIVVAVILAFLFRAFVAEAFVIPTGSMAPTLQGRHLDLTCPQCGYEFRTGASMENDGEGFVQRASCQVCRFPIALDRSPPGSWLKTNQDSFNGDRILVSKFAYQLADPERWDVIVFKYPGNAKQNYIKRLIGLPGETIRIQTGDVFIAEASEKEKPFEDRQFTIVRKPPSKLKSMFHLVDDTDHVGGLLRAAGWPSRWSQSNDVADSARWQIGPEGHQFAVSAGADKSWLRYRHLVPWPEDWRYLSEERLPDRLNTYRGQLITDYYAYNDFYPALDATGSFGNAWVGDLGVEADIRVESDQGMLYFDLVEGGMHYQCRIDVAHGTAQLFIEGADGSFVNEEGAPAETPTARTRLQGSGKYRVLFANADDQLLLWINDKLVEFDGPTTYQTVYPPPTPQWAPDDPGDLAPAGIGGENIDLLVTRLKVLRDVYYQAVERDHKSEYAIGPTAQTLQRIFSNPHEWDETDLFRQRRFVYFELDEDQYFPMGDNSPQSKDARLWSEWGTREMGYDNPPPYVARELMIGKALLIYWPHAWRPFLPNFSRMGLIR